MQDLILIVEEHGREDSVTRLLLLLFNERIETSDGIVGQSLHGTTAVQDKNNFGQTVIHEILLCHYSDGWSQN